MREEFSAASASASGELSSPVTQCAGVLVGDRECDRSRSGADVEHPRRFELGDQRERAVDEDLRLGPRDQGPPIDREGQATEPPLAEHVLERLAACPPADELARGGELRWFNGRSNDM